MIKFKKVRVYQEQIDNAQVKRVSLFTNDGTSRVYRGVRANLDSNECLIQEILTFFNSCFNNSKVKANIIKKTVRIDDELYNELSTYSTITDQTMQDCVREAVAYYVTDMRKKQQNIKDRRFTFIDLFAGIGGMRIAFERAGGHCVYSNEWNKYSQQTYFANFGA